MALSEGGDVCYRKCPVAFGCCIERIWRRSVTTWLKFEDCLKVQDTNGVLLIRIEGAHQAGHEESRRGVVSYRISVVSLRSDLVILPPGLEKLTKSTMISEGH